MRKFAEHTRVPVTQSRGEIEKLLARYGADQFMYGSEATRALIAFRLNGRHVRLILPLPEAKSSKDEQEIRRRWRSLAMVVKAKLEACAAGVAVFDDEWMAHIVLPDGQTVGQFMRPQITEAYSKGAMPRLLPGPAA